MNSFIQPYDLTALITDHLLGTSKTKHKRKKTHKISQKGVGGKGQVIVYREYRKR